MTEREASLIIRMTMALGDEGIGPARPEPGDNAIVDEAVRVAGHLFDEHYDLWEHSLVTGDVHLPRCDKPH